MADPKNETGKSPSQQKSGGADQTSGAKISAGTSVGNVGESPMPHAQNAQTGAQNGSKPAQSSTLASHTSQPLGGRGSDNRTQQQGNQASASSGSESGKTQQATEKVREVADQARQRAGDAYEAASEWAQDTYERASDWASDRYQSQQGRLRDVRSRSAKQFGQARNGIQNYVSENPMVVGLVGLAAGLLLGALLPRTRRENEVFGEWADEVRNQGLRYARTATERGREYVEEAFSGDEEQFSRHESEFRPDRPGANSH
ncbi:hypothetical protein [Microvirga rosea]|uniref:hypothetical protein n=1 Tax=Microvirga rosea TaxID=2715425 RepID=UPI001D0B90B8|nr:hypothetical protein [Microvirga rosea]MCB8821662.1 hypothetical protein [Microvirga rosea]